MVDIYKGPGKISFWRIASYLLIAALFVQSALDYYMPQNMPNTTVAENSALVSYVEANPNMPEELTIDEALNAAMDDFDPLRDGVPQEFFYGLDEAQTTKEKEALGESYHQWFSNRNLATLCLSDPELPQNYQSAPATKVNDDGHFTSVLTLELPNNNQRIFLINNRHIGEQEYYDALREIILQPNISYVIWEGIRYPDSDSYTIDKWEERGEEEGMKSLGVLLFHAGEDPPEYQQWFNVDINSAQFNELKDFERDITSMEIIYRANAQNEIYMQRTAEFSEWQKAKNDEASSTSILKPTPTPFYGGTNWWEIDLNVYDENNPGTRVGTSMLAYVCGRNPLFYEGINIIDLLSDEGDIALVSGAAHAPNLVYELELDGWKLTNIDWYRSVESLQAENSFGN